MGEGLDDPARIDELRRTIGRKAALRRLYAEIYGRYREVLARCPQGGVALELGSGGGFAKEAVPGLVTSDVIPYRGVDVVVDGTAMPFRDGALRALLMLNVLHHVPDVAALLREAERCLRPGGRVLIVDQYPGIVGGPVYRFLHHEPFDARARDWAFPSSGPLSSANGALAWIVFERDRERLRREHPGLELVSFRPHTPLRYWLAGGLKRWSLLPGPLFPLASVVDRLLIAVSQRFGSFVDVELRRIDRS